MLSTDLKACRLGTQPTEGLPMLQTQPNKADPSEFSRCDGSEQLTDHGKALSPTQKSDAAIKENIYRAFWKEDVLQALGYLWNFNFSQRMGSST